MNAKVAPVTPNAMRIEQALNASAPLSRLRALIDDSRARLEAIRPLLPAALRPHVKPGPVDDAGWSLLAANASVAAKLRQLQPRLEETLRETGWQVHAIRIKVMQPVRLAVLANRQNPGTFGFNRSQFENAAVPTIPIRIESTSRLFNRTVNMMQRDKGLTPAPKKRMVWRITEAAPQGEMVDLSLPQRASPPLPPVERSQPGWAMSSFELLNGVEVTEDDPETVPDELFDELFKKSE